MSYAVYNPADQITTLPRKTGISTYTNETRQYNSLLQMTRLTFGSLDMEYIYSPTQNNGRITQSIEHVSNQTINYTYDPLNRLSTAQASSPCLNRSFSADSFGQYTSGEIPPAVRDGSPDPATSLGIRSCSRDKSQ